MHYNATPLYINYCKIGYTRVHGAFGTEVAANYRHGVSCLYVVDEEGDLHILYDFQKTGTLRRSCIILPTCVR